MAHRSLRDKDMSDNKAIKPTIRVFRWWNSASHPANGHFIFSPKLNYSEQTKNALLPMVKNLKKGDCHLFGPLRRAGSICMSTFTISLTNQSFASGIADNPSGSQCQGAFRLQEWGGGRFSLCERFAQFPAWWPCSRRK